MNSYDTNRYANAIKEYERKKRTLFLFPHDDKTAKAYIKKSFMWFMIMALLIAVLCAVVGVVLGFVGTDTHAYYFKAIFGLYGVVFAGLLPHNYLMFMNYIEEENGAYGIGVVVSGFFAYLGYFMSGKSFVVAAIVYFVACPFAMLISKKTYFDSCVQEPNQSDYEKK